jgi:hypothetical protein
MTPDKAKSLANDLSCAIATLQAIADELMTAYPDSDYDYHDDEPEQEAATIPEPKPEQSKPALKLDDVRPVLAEKSRNGFTPQVKALLTKYGVSKLSQLDPAHYEALLKEAEGIK